MAKVDSIIPFIRKTEGGLSRDTYDPASKNPCTTPFFGEYGYHTSNGWTWTKWVESNGNDANSVTRWYNLSEKTMYDATMVDWTNMFKKYFWNLILGDQINSQRIANMIADWYFNSCKYASKDVQVILDTLFNDHLAQDGCCGPATIESINSADEPSLYQDIADKRKNFYHETVIANPSDEKYLEGWITRVNDLVAYNSSLTPIA